jgi:hypothetical protein
MLSLKGFNMPRRCSSIITIVAKIAMLQLGVRVPERQSGAANLPCNKAQVCKNSVTSDRIQR